MKKMTAYIVEFVTNAWGQFVCDLENFVHNNPPTRATAKRAMCYVRQNPRQVLKFGALAVVPGSMTTYTAYRTLRIVRQARRFNP